MKKSATAITVSRDSYGAIDYIGQTNTTTSYLEIFKSAKKLVEIAALAKKIPAAFDSMYWGSSGRERDKKIGDALHHEIYDITADGRTVLVCCRTVSGDKYGQKTTGKEYFFVKKFRSSVKVDVASKALAAKAAKSTSELGAAIAKLAGK